MNQKSTKALCVLSLTFLPYRCLASSKNFDIKEWLISLGFGQQIKDIHFDANQIEEFKDG